jgi:hypothetical protein
MGGWGVIHSCLYQRLQGLGPGCRIITNQKFCVYFPLDDD